MMASLICQVVGSLLTGVTGLPGLGVSHLLGHLLTSFSTHAHIIHIPAHIIQTPAHIIQQTYLVGLIHVATGRFPEQQEGKSQVQSTLNRLLISHLLKHH